MMRGNDLGMRLQTAANETRTSNISDRNVRLVELFANDHPILTAAALDSGLWRSLRLAPGLPGKDSLASALHWFRPLGGVGADESKGPN